jgi:hypothetical protein
MFLLTMIQKHDVNILLFKFDTYVLNISHFLGYPVTCLRFYANKDDLKSDHQKMVAATCM